MNHLIGCITFACIVVLGRTGGALARRSSQPTVEAQDYLFIGVVVAALFFLQYAIERYLIPPNLLAKEQRKALLEAAETGYRKTFFRGAIGLSYFWLILYAWDYLRPFDPAARGARNWIGYSAFFLMLGLLARARGVILHLAEQTRVSREHAGH